MCACHRHQHHFSFLLNFRKNEEIDDKSMIKRLRTRVAELEAENNMLKHGSAPSPDIIDEAEKPNLTKEDREFCQLVVDDFLKGRLLDPVVAGTSGCALYLPVMADALTDAGRCYIRSG